MQCKKEMWEVLENRTIISNCIHVVSRSEENLIVYMLYINVVSRSEENLKKKKAKKVISKNLSCASTLCDCYFFHQ